MPGFPASPSSPRPAPPSRNASPTDRRAEAPQSRGVVVAKPQFITDAYVLEPGSSGNNVSTPHQAGFDPAGDLVLVTCIAPADWTPSAAQCIASDYTTAANGAYRLTLNTDGTLSFQNSVAGVADVANANLVPVPGAADGDFLWLYWYRQSSDGTTDFKYAVAPPSVDPATLTYTNIQVNRAAQAGVLTAPTADVHIGGYSGGTLAPFAGKVFRVIAYHSTAMATRIWDMNPGDWSSGTTWVSATTGETWTINGTASVVPAVGAAPSQALPAQVATLALTAVPGGVTPGTAALPAQVATLTLTAVPGAVVPGTAALPSQIATLTLTAVPGSVVPGTASLPSQIATLTLTAMPGAVVPGGAALPSQGASLTLTATPGAVTPGTAALPSQTALLTLTAVPGSVTPGNVNLPSQVALLTLTAVPGSVSAGAAAQTLPAQVATLTLTAVPGGVVVGTAALPSQTATLALTAVPGGVVGGTALLPSQVALLTLTATPGFVVVATSQNLPSQTALLTLTAMPGRVIAKRVYHGGARQQGQVPRPYKTPKPQRMRVEYGPNGEMYLLPVDGDPETRIDNPLPPEVELPIVVPVAQDPFTLVSDDELLLLLC